MVKIDGSFKCKGCNTLFIAPKEINKNWQQYTLMHKRIINNNDLVHTDDEWIEFKNLHKAEVTALHTSYTTAHPHNIFTTNIIEDHEYVLHLEIHVTEKEAVIDTRLPENMDLIYLNSLRLSCPQCTQIAYIVRDAYAPKPPPALTPIIPPAPTENGEEEESE